MRLPPPSLPLRAVAPGAAVRAVRGAELRAGVGVVRGVAQLGGRG